MGETNPTWEEEQTWIVIGTCTSNSPCNRWHGDQLNNLAINGTNPSEIGLDL